MRRFAWTVGVVVLACGCGSAAAPLDSGTDAPTPDAGPCGVCSETLPRCDLATSSCVECLEAADCAAGRPFCVEGRCLECTSDVDCDDPTASRCGGGTCGACITDFECAHLSATPMCDVARRRCVECTGETEAARCGDRACAREEGVCTENARGTLDFCEPCRADSECLVGACVPHAFMDEPVGTFCFVEAAEGACASDELVLRRPYSTAAWAISVDGREATYCLPPATTTCAGIRSTRLASACHRDEVCGATGVADGHCTSELRCSYLCSGERDCPSGHVCSGEPMHCVLEDVAP